MQRWPLRKERQKYNKKKSIQLRISKSVIWISIGFLLLACIGKLAAQTEAGGAAPDGGGAANDGARAAPDGEGGAAGGGEGGAAGGGEGGAAGGDGGAAGEGGKDDKKTDAAPPTIDEEDVGQDQRYGFRGMGTTHEEMGQSHWDDVEYTKYVSNVKFREPREYPDRGLTPIYNFTHLLYEKTLVDEPPLPEGYVAIKSDQTLALGPKFNSYDFRDLLWEYWYYLLWVLFLLLIIILIPFIAVCYCCFCCCRRCSRGCPPCDRNKKATLRYLCGFLFLLLIAVLVFGTLIAFLADKSIDHGLTESKFIMRRIADDTCTFLKDIHEHIDHLFSRNYEEMSNQVQEMIINADRHMFLDLGDTSEANAIEELERILDNMALAMSLMKDVQKLEKELRFLNYQLRDGIRGVKRDIITACAAANHWACTKLVRETALPIMDTMKCLHLDQLPVSQKYLDGMEFIIDNKVEEIPKNALLQLQKIKDQISEEMNKVGPPILVDIKKGRDKFLHESNKIHKVINVAVSDIHFNTARQTKSLEDIYEKFSEDRSLINSIVCIILCVIIGFMFFALLCGCLFSKPAGANCLLLVMILIFCFISFIAIVGLFYFIVGLLTYQGTCVPTKEQDRANVFRNIDSRLDAYANDQNTGNQVIKQPVKVSNAIKSCKLDESIFNVLSTYKLYDIDDLKKINIISDGEDLKYSEIQKDFKDMFHLTTEEKIQLTEIKDGNLSTYHSSLYLSQLCNRLTPWALNSMAWRIEEAANDMYYRPIGELYERYWTERVALYDGAKYLRAYDSMFVGQINALKVQMKDKLLKIDDLILYNNNDFGNTIRILLETIMRAEAFMKARGKLFISELVDNLTNSVADQVDLYTDMVGTECLTRVGRCEPLTYIYTHGVDSVCNHLIDPLNAFWFGILLCVLAFLPALFIAHHLMCLYRSYSPLVVATQARRYGNCPICTGTPYMAPPIIACSGGQQVFKGAGRSAGGNYEGDFILSIDQLRKETFVLEEKESQTLKEKRKKE